MEPHIIVDSCCDLTPTLRSVLGVSVASLQIDVNGKHYVDDESLDTVQLVADMKADKNPPSTACPSPQEYADLMGKHSQSFVVTLSSKLSGSYNAACIGRDLALEKNPSLQIHIFDSQSAAAGQTRIALLLRDMIDAGMPYEKIIEDATEFIRTMRTRFVLEDLSNLVKNGRVSKAAGILGSMLSLRPLMADNGVGEIVALEKIRGTQKAMCRLVEHVAEETAQMAQESITMVLSYCNCAERAMELKKNFLEQCNALKEVILVPTGGISTVYAYQGGIVVAF